jgi:hypothetical protein
MVTGTHFSTADRFSCSLTAGPTAHLILQNPLENTFWLAESPISVDLVVNASYPTYMVL